MSEQVTAEVKNCIASIMGTDFDTSFLTDDFQLVGNVLDSMAVTNLILAIEESFGITFNDDDLSVEEFETIATLTKLVERKLSS